MSTFMRTTLLHWDSQIISSNLFFRWGGGVLPHFNSCQALLICHSFYKACKSCASSSFVYKTNLIETYNTNWPECYVVRNVHWILFKNTAIHHVKFFWNSHFHPVNNSFSYKRHKTLTSLPCFPPFLNSPIKK